MFILLTLFTMLVILTIFLIVGVASAGAAFLIVFGDIVVAIVFIVMLIKHILKKRSKQNFDERSQGLLSFEKEKHVYGAYDYQGYGHSLVTYIYNLSVSYYEETSD